MDVPALIVLGGLLAALTVGLVISGRMLPVRAGQVRQARSEFMMPSYGLTVGLFFIGYGLYLLHVRGDETGSVPIFFSSIFVVPTALRLWQCARWRISIEAEGLRQRLWPFGERLLPWSRIAEISLDRRRGQFIIKAPPAVVRLPTTCEGLPFLLDAARKRSMPIAGVTHDGHGWRIDEEG